MVASEILGIDWQKKVGPLPMYGWGVVVAGGAVGAVLLMRKHSSNTATVPTATAPMLDTSSVPSSGNGGSSGTPGVDLSPLLAAISQQGQAEQQGFAGILSAEQQGFAALQTTEQQNAQQNQSFLAALVQTLQAGNTAVLNAIASIANNGSASNPQNTPSTSGVNPGGPMVTTTTVGGLAADSGMTLLTNPGGQSYQVPTPVASYYQNNPVSTNEIPTNPSVENAVPYNGPGTQGTGGPYWVDIAAAPNKVA